LTHGNKRLLTYLLIIYILVLFLISSFRNSVPPRALVATYGVQPPVASVMHRFLMYINVQNRSLYAS